MDYATEAQERALGILRQSQDAVIEAVGSWAKAVESSVPDSPALPVPEGTPTINELVHSSFDFADQVLSTQRSFTEKLISATAPAIKTAPVAATKAAAKKTA
jgi:hypothetical protein